MTSDIFEVIENSLSRAGYKVLWGEGASIVIQHANSDVNYRIAISEEAKWGVCSVTYAQAKKLHSGDEVGVKWLDVILRVVEVEHDQEHRDIFVMCDDGVTYHHTALR